MTHRSQHTPIRRPLKRLLALACAFLCVTSAFAARVTLSSVSNLGYIYLHPMFDRLSWQSTLDRLDLGALPDTLLTITVKSFDVSRGADNGIAVYTTSSGDLFIMSVLYKKATAPCSDHALTFDNPRKVALSGLSLSSGKPLCVVHDSLYASDSVRVVIPSSAAPLKLLVPTIRTAAAAIERIDTITCSERRTGQQILGVSGAVDSVTGQDLGIWVTGSNGLVRYIPYANHRFGSEAVRDLGEATVSVTHTNGTFAVSTQGRIFRKNPADTFFTFAVAASGALRRVYPGGAIGDNGLFKEFANGTWRADKTFGSASYRYANFIRRPGGFGVELLDSSWAYSVYTYRDTTSRIAVTSPASLATNIDGVPYVYNGQSQLDITVMLDDPDSNFSDYSLSQVSAGGGTAVDLKNDGTYAIVPLSDSVDCHIGSIKMTSGRVRLTLNDSQITVMHDCARGALDPTCLVCYWKSYNFQLTNVLRKADTIRIRTGQHLLRIAADVGSVTMNRTISAQLNATIFPIHFASGNRCSLLIPFKQGNHAVSIAIYDLKGRLIADIPLRRDQQSLDLSNTRCSGVVIVTCIMNDGTTQRTMTRVTGR
jgi:hypothetical protein